MSDALDRFETLGWVYRPAELAVILSRLEHEEILVFAASYRHVSAQWTLAVALGGVELRVPAAQAEAARALFAEQEPLPPRNLFSANRLIEALALLLLFVTCGMVAAPGLSAEFILPRREASRA